MAERYVITGRLGEGGAGAVYRAQDTQLNRTVAIKRLLDGEQGDQAAKRREELLREASLLCAVQHPNICQVFDYGVDEDGGFVVMEYIDGEELSAVAKRRISPREFLDIAEQVLDGVAEAHAHRILHRDLKPENIMINWLPGGSAQVKILDFGLAKFVLAPSQQTIDQTTHSAKGSIHFMAPEQFEHRPLDDRTDLYSLGCLFFLLLTAQHPFNGSTMPEIMTRHLAHQITAPLDHLRPDLPPALVQWIGWLMNREMENRPATAVEALRVLREIRPSVLSESQTVAVAAPTEFSEAATAPLGPPPAVLQAVMHAPGPRTAAPTGRSSPTATSARRPSGATALKRPAPWWKRKPVVLGAGAVVVVAAAGLAVALFPRSEPPAVVHRGEKTEPERRTEPPPPPPAVAEAPPQDGLLLWLDASQGVRRDKGRKPAQDGESVDHWADRATALAGDNAAVYHSVTTTPDWDRVLPVWRSLANEGGLKGRHGAVVFDGKKSRLVLGRGRDAETGSPLGTAFSADRFSFFACVRGRPSGNLGRLVSADVGSTRTAWSVSYGQRQDWISGIRRASGESHNVRVPAAGGVFCVVTALWDRGADSYRLRVVPPDQPPTAWERLQGPVASGEVSEIRVGSSPGSTADFFDGDVTEILLYNRCLSDDEAATVEEYLRHRYFR